ncbi:MAG: phage tail protein [Erythrobacter sp.]|nr:phage tail protein [Erythrobacter sp.]NCQ62972.1 phage tail protein [Alphaproteobacteria bacterium]
MKIKATALALLALTGASFGTATPAAAQPEPFIGQISYFGFEFCPKGWLRADGQLLAISQYNALFALLGTRFGGNGVQSFALPDLRGRVPLGDGRGPGLTPRTLGERGGSETNVLNVAQMPQHTHTATLRANNSLGTSDNPTGNLLADFPDGNAIYSPGPADTSMGSSAIVVSPMGGSQPVNNIQPYQVLTACVAVTGIFPSRP